MTLTVETYGTLAEADAARRGDGRYLAGGTLVMRDLNYAVPGLSRVLRVSNPPRAIRQQGERLSMDAGVTMADVIESREAAFLAPVARSVGGPAVRNMATVGGNLFAAHPYGDFTAALLALDGEVQFVDGRTQPMEAFLAERDRAPLVASITMRMPRTGEFRFRKVARVKPKGVSVMSIAAWLPGAPMRVSQVRIAFGAMGPTPLRARAAEQVLEGRALDASGIERALSVATQGLAPVDDALASAWYRNEVAPVHLRRLLLDAEPGR